METLLSLPDPAGILKPDRDISAGQRQAADHVRRLLGTYGGYLHWRTFLALSGASPAMLLWVVSADTEELRSTGLFLPLPRDVSFAPLPSQLPAREV